MIRIRSFIDNFTKYVASVSNLLLGGMMLVLPLAMSRKGYLRGISGQDVFFYIIVMVAALLAIRRVLSSDVGDIRSLPTVTRVLCILCALCSLVLGWQMAHTDLQGYKMAEYAAAFLFIISVRVLGGRSAIYLKIFVFPLTVIYVLLFYHLFTGEYLLFDISPIVASAVELIPLLILGSVASSTLYFMCDYDRLRTFFAVICAAGFVLLFLYGDMTSFCIVFLFLILIPSCYADSLRNLKKSFTLLFIYGFCASNTALIPYFEVKGLEGHNYNLEYSIYIDIIIALVGLIASKYMERYQDAEPDMEIKDMPLIFRVVRGIFCAVLAGALVFNEGISSLPDTWGINAVRAFSASLTASVHGTRGEWWYLIQRYGFVGLAAAIIVICLFCVYVFKNNRWLHVEQGDAPWLVLSGIFIIQSLFYPLSVMSLPVYLLCLAFGLSEGGSCEDMAEVMEDVAEDTVMAAEEIAIAAIEDVDDFMTEELEFVEIDELESDDRMKSRATRHLKKMSRKRDRVGHRLTRVSVLACGGLCSAVLLVLTVLVISRWTSSGIINSGADMPLTALARETFVTPSYGSEETAEVSWERLAYRIYDRPVRISRADTDVDEAENAITESISNGDYHIYDPDAYYESVSDIVVPAELSTRLRSEPSLGDEGEVVHVLGDGERIVRDGIGNNGWSRLIWRGHTCYAVTDYLSVVGTYHGDPSELISERSADEETEDVSDDEAVGASDDETEQDTDEAEQADADTASDNTQRDTRATSAAYNLLWSSDNKSCTIWSAGVQQGTMSVTDGTTAQSIHVYPDHYIGSGDNRRRYLSISVSATENPVSVQADSGFVEALKNMGYSGIYFNKRVINW